MVIKREKRRQKEDEETIKQRRPMESYLKKKKKMKIDEPADEEVVEMDVGGSDEGDKELQRGESSTQ